MSQATWIGFLPFLSAMPGLLGQRIRTHEKTTKFNLLYLAPSDKSNSRDFLWKIRHSYIQTQGCQNIFLYNCPNIVLLVKRINIQCHLSFSNTARCKSDSWFGPYWQLTPFLRASKIHYWYHSWPTNDYHSWLARNIQLFHLLSWSQACRICCLLPDLKNILIKFKFNQKRVPYIQGKRPILM